MAVLVLGFSPAWADESSALSVLLSEVREPDLRLTLQNSISAGLITDRDEFTLALSRARHQRGGNNGGSGLSAAISKA